MQLTSQSAIDLAAIILTETQGVDRLRMQLPLNIADLNDRWLVSGTHYSDNEAGLDYCQFYVTFRKDSAEIVGLGSEASMRISETNKKITLQYTTEERFEEAFGPRKLGQLDGSDLKLNLAFIEMLYGGLINSNRGAIYYAQILIQSSPALAAIPVEALDAEEISSVWHVKRKSSRKPILSFSRLTGRILSADFR